MANRNFFKPAFDKLATNNVIGDPYGKPAYAYIRVSGDDQADDGRSELPRQIAHIHEIAQEKGYRIDWDCVFADDFSGFTFEDRPGLTQLRKEYASPHRRANAVLMEHLDRLSRNADWHQGFLLSEMQEHKLTVIFWREFSSLIERSVLGAVAQEGMEQAKRRMMEGNLHKARSGRVTARVAAFGYKLVDAEGNEGTNARKDTHYAIKEEEAVIIHRIFSQVAQGIAMGKISTDLTEAGIAPPKNSKFWTPTQIRLFIKNEVYKGDFYAHRWQHIKVQKPTKDGLSKRIVQRKVERPREEWIHVPVPPIVSKELWEAANRIIQQNKKMARRNAKHPYLLTGLVHCAQCGRVYVGTTSRLNHGKPRKRPYRGYRCARHSAPHHILAASSCDNGDIKCDILDGAVWHVICDVLLQPDVLIEALEQSIQSDRNQQLQAQIDYLEQEIDKRDHDDDKLFRAYLAGAFDEEEFAARRKLLKEESLHMQQEAAELRSQVMTPEQLEVRKEEVLTLSRHIQTLQLPVDPPFELKQRIIKLLVDKIILDVNKGTFTFDGAIAGLYMIGKTPARAVI